MCWVALDRASSLAEIRGDADLAASWSETADEIKDDILTHGTRDDVLRQHYDTDALDASTLLAAIFGFLPGDDERLRKSVMAIADDLTENGFVLRYRTDETDDGLSGKEGSFLISQSPRPSASMRRSSTPRPPATSGTSHRLSPIWL
jgi:GH15 family glucan-1,4-alpha-glucosidase